LKHLPKDGARFSRDSTSIITAVCFWQYRPLSECDQTMSWKSIGMSVPEYVVKTYSNENLHPSRIQNVHEHTNGICIDVDMKDKCCGMRNQEVLKLQI